jgi:hypothetical protein
MRNENRPLTGDAHSIQYVRDGERLLRRVGIAALLAAAVAAAWWAFGR